MLRALTAIFSLILLPVSVLFLYAFTSQAHAADVNKCIINGKVSYQERPCPVNAKAKTVDTSGKDTKDLGKDFAKSAKEDKEKLDAIEKEKAAKAAAETAALSDKPQMPQLRNPALERIEKFFKGK
jgi:hypothetical protein